MVSYFLGHGPGVPCLGRPDPAPAARRAVRPRRPVAARAREPVRHDPGRGGQTPEGARGGGPRGLEPARAREAAPPQPCPHPPGARPLGHQVHRALDDGTPRPQDRTGATMEKVFEIYIRTTPERLWQAITDGDLRAHFHFGNRITSDWTPGSPTRSPLQGRRAAGPWHQRRGRAPAPAGADLHRPLGRGRPRRGHEPGHLADRAGRRLVPAAPHPRPAGRGRRTSSSTAAGR